MEAGYELIMFEEKYRMPPDIAMVVNSFHNRPLQDDPSTF